MRLLTFPCVARPDPVQRELVLVDRWRLGRELDGPIFVVARDWVAVAFHGFVLFMLLGGYAVAQRVVAEHPRLAASAAA